MVAGGAFGRIWSSARQVFAVVALALVLPVASADAGTRLCRQLEAQLAAVPVGGGGASAQARRFDAAITRQEEQMRTARAQARQAGCGRAMTGRAVSFCGSLNATLQRMESNLADLQAKRARLGGSGDGRRERARITAALNANGCLDRDVAPRRQEAGSQSRTPQSAAGAAGTVRRLSGNFRTMCVRACDGYYFPISYSVSQAAFERDANACRAMCPGTAVELHYHRMPGQEADQMVSAATGLPYSEMENAFKYRRTDASTPAGCGCGAAAQGARGFEVIAGNYGSGIVEDREDGDTMTAAIPRPSARPDPAEDPETLAARQGGLDAETMKRLARPIRQSGSPPAPGDDGERAVRVVGPVFLPDPEEAIDLRVQDPNRAR